MSARAGPAGPCTSLDDGRETRALDPHRAAPEGLQSRLVRIRTILTLTPGGARGHARLAAARRCMIDTVVR
jgi:hypothetical protein